MEHRWGERVEVVRAVLLVSQPHRECDPVLGVLRNVSVSGAYVETSREMPVLSQITVEFEGANIEACVVRRDAHGIGLEWSEFAPPEIVALCRAPQPVGTLPGYAEPSPLASAA